MPIIILIIYQERIRMGDYSKTRVTPIEACSQSEIIEPY